MARIVSKDPLSETKASKLANLLSWPRSPTATRNVRPGSVYRSCDQCRVHSLRHALESTRCRSIATCPRERHAEDAIAKLREDSSCFEGDQARSSPSRVSRTISGNLRRFRVYGQDIRVVLSNCGPPPNIDARALKTNKSIARNARNLRALRIARSNRSTRVSRLLQYSDPEMYSESAPRKKLPERKTIHKR
jgi:hypothetical protein